MFRRRNQIEVVPESDYTDFSHRFEESNAVTGRSNATKETYIAAALVPITGALGYKAFFSNPTPSATPTPTIPEVIPVSAQPQIIEPVMTPISQLAQTPISYSDPNMIPVNAIGDASLDILTTILDPIIDILVALSFPVCSVMIVGSLFFLMFGKDDRAMSGIMKAALGYCLIQLSPLLLNILHTLGKSVVPQ